jgi:hypothetical protein
MSVGRYVLSVAPRVRTASARGSIALASVVTRGRARETRGMGEHTSDVSHALWRRLALQGIDQTSVQRGPRSIGSAGRGRRACRGSARRGKRNDGLWSNPHPDSTMTRTTRFARGACQAALRPVASAIASKGTTKPQPNGSIGLGPPSFFQALQRVLAHFARSVRPPHRTEKATSDSDMAAKWQQGSNCQGQPQQEAAQFAFCPRVLGKVTTRFLRAARFPLVK